MKLGISFAIITLSLATLIGVAPASAQATRTWVSGVGDDVNPCSRTAPCKTFAGAISKTARGGEISVLDPGGFGNVTITKSITINGTPGAGYGSILVPAASTGVIINITDPADTRRVVRLNWLDINGAGTAANGVRILSSLTGTSVIIENTNIDGYTGRGISDERPSGGNLMLNNVTISNSNVSGITMATASGQTVASFSNVRIDGTPLAISAANRVRGNMRDVTLAHNGIGIQTSGVDNILNIHNLMVSFATTGVQASAGSTVRIANSVITQNSNGVSPSGGTIVSMSGNSVTGNTADGVFSSTVPQL